MLTMSAAASVEVGGVMRGSRIPVKRGSSVRYEAVKSLQAGLGSRIPVRQGTSMRYVMISLSLPHSLSPPVHRTFFMRLMLTIHVTPTQAGDCKISRKDRGVG